MKNILYKILLITLIGTNICAKINEEQVDKYMKFSEAEELLKYLQNDMLYRLINIYNLDLNNTSSEIIHSIKDELNSSIYVKKYTETFKDYEPSEYETMASFYNTKSGKKYAQNIKKYFNLEKNSSKIELYDKFKIFLAKHPFSEEKKIIVQKITQNLNIVTIFINIIEGFNIYREYALPTKYNIHSISYMKLMKKELQKNYNLNKSWEEETDMIYFKDFSEQELKEILEYTKTHTANVEYRLILKAINAYYKAVINDIMED